MAKENEPADELVIVREFNAPRELVYQLIYTSRASCTLVGSKRFCINSTQTRCKTGRHFSTSR